MATVTIGQSYFEALMRRAEFHTSSREFVTLPSLSNNVIISKAEHDDLLKKARQLDCLIRSLHSGGIQPEVLETLLRDPDEHEHASYASYASFQMETPPPEPTPSTYGETFVRPRHVPVTIRAPETVDQRLEPRRAVAEHTWGSREESDSDDRGISYVQPESSADSPNKADMDDQPPARFQRTPPKEQRTILITNLTDRATHKDIADIIRGGRVLDIFLRNDRCATVTLAEGAREFLAYTKKNDIYMHSKRLEFRWCERQFHIPQHVMSKIGHGASRNFVIRSAANKNITPDEIREHLDHIHNLAVLDIKMVKGDAHISTNSVHNCLFAKTCLMSRSAYKGLRIDFEADECANPLPKPASRSPPAPSRPVKVAAHANPFAVLDGTDSDVEDTNDSDDGMESGVRLYD